MTTIPTITDTVRASFDTFYGTTSEAEHREPAEPTDADRERGPARIEAQRERVEAMVTEHRERAAASRADAGDVFGEDEPAWMAIDDAEVDDDAARSDRAWADACECRRCHAEGHVEPTFAERLAEQLTINASPAGRRARRRAKVRARLARIDWLTLGALGSPIALAVHVGGRPVALYLAAAAALVCLLVGAVEVSAVVVGYLRGLLGFGPRAGER